jgi:hypothetical protein
MQRVVRILLLAAMLVAVTQVGSVEEVREGGYYMGESASACASH